jgi:hypothetical protein
VLHDSKTRITPRHVLLYYVFLPALTRSVVGEWQHGVRPGDATDCESGRNDITRVHGMFLHTVMLATPVPSLPLKQRANLASLQILMGTYFQHLISTPRRWSEQGLPGLFPGVFCSPWSKPVDLCSVVVLTGSEITTLFDAYQQYLGMNRQASDSISEASYTALMQICDRSLEVDSRQPYMIPTEEDSVTSATVFEQAPSDIAGVSEVQTNETMTNAAIAKCQIVLRSAYDQLRIATAESTRSGSPITDGLAESLHDILSQIERDYTILESFVAEPRRLESALTLAKAYSRELQLHGELIERMQSGPGDPADERAYAEHAGLQFADMLHDEVESEVAMDFSPNELMKRSITGEDSPKKKTPFASPFSPTSPLATLMSTVFSPMNIS